MNRPHRFRRNIPQKFWWHIGLYYFFMGVVVLSIPYIAAIKPDSGERSLPASGPGLALQNEEEGGEVWELLDIHLHKSRKYLEQAVPGLELYYNQQVKYQTGYFQTLCETLNKIRFRKPFTFLQAAVISLAGFSPPEQPVERVRDEEKNPPEFLRELKKPPQLWDTFDQSPRIAIYHSHTSESYMATKGKTRNSNGMPGDVVKAGEIIAETLWRKYGIAVIHNKKVHDFPVWRKSYVNSLATAEALVNENKNLFALIDVHRDAGTKENPAINSTVINGKNAAKVFIVVGSNRLGLPHPHWQKNYSFALKMQNKMDSLYPGLCRGVNLRHDGRWNQHVHPHSIILEVGDVYSRPADVAYSCELVADVLAEMVIEDSSRN